VEEGEKRGWVGVEKVAEKEARRERAK